MRDNKIIRQPILIIALLICLLPFPAPAQRRSATEKRSYVLSLVRAADGVYVTASSAVSGLVLEVYQLSGERVFASEPYSGAKLKLRVGSGQGAPLPDGQYLYIVTSQVSPALLVKYFGRLTLQPGMAEMLDSSEILGSYERHYFAQRNLAMEPGSKQADIDREFGLYQDNARQAALFFAQVVKMIPESAEALLGHGFALAATHGLTVSQLTEILDPETPPPPPPPADPDRPVSKAPPMPQARQPEINREGLARAIAAFRQGADLADCRSRAERWLFAAAIHARLEEADKANALRLQAGGLACAPASTRALAWYALAVDDWRRVNGITERHTDQQRAMFTDPWYYREIPSGAELTGLNESLARGLAYVEKTLALDPGNDKAVFYQSLLYREKQKTTKSPAERRKYEALAEKAMDRALKQRRRQ
ncbi:MAG: hypothetical protein ACKV2V_26130 [Blastocatellia bacterium]